MLSSTTRRSRFKRGMLQKSKPSLQRGFSLFEVAIVLVIVAILFTAVGVPLASQVQARRIEETRKLLEEAKDALLGFAVANGRFPCPAIATSVGQESFCPAGSPTGTCGGSETTVVQTHGNCSNFYNGFLPAAALGLSGLDQQGFLRDSWGEEANRIRYAVYSPNRNSPPITVGGENHPFTRPGGMQSATLTVLGDATAASPYMHVCASGTGVTASSCGATPANTLTTRAPILLYSLGPNASAIISGTTTAGTDEAENLPASNNKVFVSHTPVDGGANQFDDVVTWISISTIIKKMLDAGKLP